MRVGGGDTEFGPKEGIHWHVSEDHKVTPATERVLRLTWREE
jgi:hypothetical protein